MPQSLELVPRTIGKFGLAGICGIPTRCDHGELMNAARSLRRFKAASQTTVTNPRDVVRRSLVRQHPKSSVRSLDDLQVPGTSAAPSSPSCVPHAPSAKMRSMNGIVVAPGTASERRRRGSEYRRDERQYSTETQRVHPADCRLRPLIFLPASARRIKPSPPFECPRGLVVDDRHRRWRIMPATTPIRHQLDRLR